VDQDDQDGENEQLVRDRIEQRAKLRRATARAREPPIEPVGAHGQAEKPRRPVVVIVELPDEESRDDGNGSRPRDRQLVGEAHRRENTCAWPFSRRCSSRTAARSPSAYSGRRASSASPASRSTLRPTA